MKPRVKKPKPDAETLKADFERLGSKAKLAHEYGVTPQTAHRWLRENGLVDPLPSDAQDEDRLSRWKEKPQEEQVIIEGELLPPQIDEQIAPIDTSNLRPSIGKLKTPNATPTQDADTDSQLAAVSDEPETAFEQLSATQKRAVAILTDRPSLSGRELAAEVGVSEQTVSAWKSSPLFQEAVREMLVPAFRMESLLMVMADLRRVINEGKARPEDRKLLAELSGLSAGEQVNVNIAVDNTGWFGKRWK